MTEDSAGRAADGSRTGGRREVGPEGPETPVADFAEVNVGKARTRGPGGRFRSLGAPVGEAAGVSRAEKVRDYRKFLATMEPAAFRVLMAALNDKRVAMKDRIEIAQDIMTRLHGKVLGSTEAEDARRKMESMSTDELKAHVIELAKEMGLDLRARTIS